MKQYFLLIFSVCFFLSCEQVVSEQIEIYPIYDSTIDKYGYVNGNLELLTPLEYHYASECYEEYCLVYWGNENWGVLNFRGNEITVDNFTFDKLNNFSIDSYGIIDGTYVFKDANGYGIKNVEGEILLQGYEYITPFSEGFAIINGKFPNVGQIVNIEGDPVDTFSEWNSSGHQIRTLFYNNSAIVKISNQPLIYGLINKNGDIIFEGNENSRIRSFSNGLYLYQERLNQLELWGYLNNYGNLCVEPQYYAAYPYSGEVAAVRFTEEIQPVGSISNTPGWKLIDKNGNTINILPEDMIIISPFNNGLCEFIQSGKYGLINEKGQIVFSGLNNCWINTVGGFWVSEIENQEYFLLNNGERVSIESVIDKN